MSSNETGSIDDNVVDFLQSHGVKFIQFPNTTNDTHSSPDMFEESNTADQIIEVVNLDEDDQENDRLVTLNTRIDVIKATAQVRLTAAILNMKQIIFLWPWLCFIHIWLEHSWPQLLFSIA